MGAWWWKRRREGEIESPEERFRTKYASFRQLLTNNNDCLELMAGLQEDMRYVGPLDEVFSKRISAIFEKTRATVNALEALSGKRRAKLCVALDLQQHEVESYLAEHREFDSPRLAMRLSEIDTSHADEVGGKAAALGEIKNKLGLPVPDGFVITTEAYRRFCGEPHWEAIRDASRNLDSDDLKVLREASNHLTRIVMDSPIPRALEVAITERGRSMGIGKRGMAVRSSAMGEGGEYTFAGQFISLLNIPEDDLVGAYKRVVAGRFGESAMAYRFTTGVLEVDTPMAVLFQPVLRAAAAGILYTRDPNHPKESQLLITATRGLGTEIASGRMPADQFLVTRDRSHIVLERRIATKESEVALRPDGGLVQKALTAEESKKASLDTENLQILAHWGLRIEEHFGTPQDVEWVLDEEDSLWIVQSRPLALTDHDSGRGKADVRGEPLIQGGQIVYPGRVSGAAYLAEDDQALDQTPKGAVLVVRQSVPEMIPVFPRIV